MRPRRSKSSHAVDSSLEGTKQPLTPAKPVSIYTLHPKNLNPKNKPYTLNPKPVHSSLDGTKLAITVSCARARVCVHMRLCGLRLCPASDHSLSRKP